ncbi:cell envelope-related transcriptional attenuator [Syntrophobotulus glycolicus DSM 8271]|uniref:Cell envelope-related transcriptional attenuator n=1 Tax=Syntrophobotulus glycolicus (strain DSM 8271 / FlGlyR) TaxID=645991 RepID=F0SWU5_SYNGF|nr:LCP family protein [Syntrophobotulus glycolicus]ADY54635.1 cell envelope-related transcriptional attenuator [Syntrophobotulus glycolicus DSM 8271]
MKKRTIVISAIIIVILSAAAINYIFQSLTYKESLKGPALHENDSNQDDNELAGMSNSINILFLGIDKTEERENWLGSYRADTIAIARINLDTQKIKILNIPRDTYSFIPVENKKDKINHAYAYGSMQGDGIKASIDAVNNLTNNKIDYYFAMDMEPVPGIVDEIGGIKLDVEIDMKDHGVNLSKGLQVLNGEQAFDYIRWRYSPGGDIDRIKRQQKFVSTFLKQQRDSGKIIETAELVLKYKDNIQMNLTFKQLIGFAKFLKEVPEGSVSYLTLPGEGKMIDGISYWVLNEEKTNELFNEFFK